MEFKEAILNGFYRDHRHGRELLDLDLEKYIHACSQELRHDIDLLKRHIIDIEMETHQTESEK